MSSAEKFEVGDEEVCRRFPPPPFGFDPDFEEGPERGDRGEEDWERGGRSPEGEEDGNRGLNGLRSMFPRRSEMGSVADR